MRDSSVECNHLGWCIFKMKKAISYNTYLFRSSLSQPKVKSKPLHFALPKVMKITKVRRVGPQCSKDASQAHDVCLTMYKRKDNTKKLYIPPTLPMSVKSSINNKLWLNANGWSWRFVWWSFCFLFPSSHKCHQRHDMRNSRLIIVSSWSTNLCAWLKR